MLLEGVVSLVPCIVESWFRFSKSGVLLILSLSFLMGLQNVVITRISNACVRRMFLVLQPILAASWLA